MSVSVCRLCPGIIYPLERALLFVYDERTIFVEYEEVNMVNFAMTGHHPGIRNFQFEVHNRADTSSTAGRYQEISQGGYQGDPRIHTFIIKIDEYHRLYDFLRNKKLIVKSTGEIPRKKEKIYGEECDPAAAGDGETENSMSSDDEDFNPDGHEDAKEQYDSEPSDTGSDTEDGLGSGSGSVGEKQKRG